MTDSFILGIDVGGTKTAVGMVRHDGMILTSRRRPAGAERGPAAMIRDYIDMAREIIEETRLPSSLLGGIGVACSGPLDPSAGVVHGPANLPGWSEVPLAAILHRELGRPVWIDNDANACALAESWIGAGRGSNPLVYMTISTGIGGGVIVDGALFHGATGNGAEIGHMVIQADGRPCGCGGWGCLEAYCSGSSIARRAREALDQDGDSALGRLGHEPRAEDVVALAKQGDQLAAALWDETVRLLSAGLVSVFHAFEPTRIVLGGGVTRAGAPLFTALNERVRARAMHQLGEHLEIVPAQLGEDVGILGAAAVALSSTRGLG